MSIEFLTISQEKTIEQLFESALRNYIVPEETDSSVITTKIEELSSLTSQGIQKITDFLLRQGESKYEEDPTGSITSN